MSDTIQSMRFSSGNLKGGSRIHSCDLRVYWGDHLKLPSNIKLSSTTKSSIPDFVVYFTLVHPGQIPNKFPEFFASCYDAHQASHADSVVLRTARVIEDSLEAILTILVSFPTSELLPTQARARGNAHPPHRPLLYLINVGC
jgi:hypothetical protein